jgi:hypothetical protein
MQRLRLLVVSPEEIYETPDVPPLPVNPLVVVQGSPRRRRPSSHLLQAATRRKGKKGRHTLKTVELVLQVRDDATGTISHHIHYHIHAPNPENFIDARDADILAYLHAKRIGTESARMYDPCPLCLTLASGADDVTR